MFDRRHMPVYLVLAWTVLDVVLGLGGMVLMGRRATEHILFPVVWGQFLAATGWIALGNRGQVAAFLCGIAWFVLLALVGNGLSSTKVISFLLGALVGVAIYAWFLMVPLLLVCLRGFQFDYAPKRPADEPPFYQVSLRGMMAYTLLVAIVCAAWSAALASPSKTESPAMAGILFTLIVPFLLPWSVWLCFCWVRPLHGGIVALLVSGLWGGILAGLINRSQNSLLFALIPSCVLIVHLLALQLAGFRFRRVRIGQWVVTDD